MIINSRGNMNKKLSALLQFLNKNKKIAIPVTSAILTILFIVLFLSLRSYKLDANVRQSADAIPSDANFYVEISNPEEFYKNFAFTDTGKAILGSAGWKKLWATPQVKHFNSLLYFLELTGGEVLTPEEITSFFGGSVGYASFGEEDYLMVARANLKSKLGLGLITAFKAKKTDAKDEQVKESKEDKENNVVSSNSYSEVYDQDLIKFHNLKIYKLTSGGKEIYFTMMSDYIFISNTISLIKKSVALAAGHGTTPFTRMKGGDSIFSNYTNKDMLIYINPTSGIKYSLFKTLIPAKALAMVVKISNENITADVINLDYQENIPATTSSLNWSDIIPNDSSLTFFNNKLAINDIIKSTSDLTGDDKEIADGFTSFFSNADIDITNYFGDKRGLAFVMNKTVLKNNRLYPQFGLAYSSAVQDDKIAQAIFKTGSINNVVFQKKSYHELDSLGKGIYQPCTLHDKNYSVVTSSKELAENFISAANNNHARLNDYKTFTEFKDINAPTNIIINIPLFLKDIGNFYYYGATNNKRYTAKTIDSDILPLFDFLKAYSYLHIAIGATGNNGGKISLSK